MTDAAEGGEATRSGPGTGVILGIVGAIGCLGLICVAGIVFLVVLPANNSEQLRAARYEAPSSLDGIRTAEKAYHAAWDSFTSVGPCPTYVPGEQGVRWDRSWPCYREFENLGWIPDGVSRCQFQVRAKTASAAADDDMVGTAECDFDGDGEHSRYKMNRAEKATMFSPSDVY